jgi:hypothetical protein
MKVILQSGLRGLSGGMQDWVYQYRDGKTYLGPKPRRTREPSQAELNQRERFKEAALYAKSALADPATREFYETVAAERGTPVFALAVGDFLNQPSIKPLDLSNYKGQVGDPILIRAVDDIGLADVEVELTASNGTQIEKGKAVENGVRTGRWTYTATAPVALGSDIFIKVVGVDHAGTETQITENPTVGMDA